MRYAPLGLQAPNLITDHGYEQRFLGAACRNRTDGLFITSDCICVDWRRLRLADVPLTCGYSDPLSAGVAQDRMPLAPRLAPLDFVSFPNARYFASGLT